MARLTARQLRHRENEVFSIDIGNGDEVLVRRPDMQLLVLQVMLLQLLSMERELVMER